LKRPKELFDDQSHFHEVEFSEKGHEHEHEQEHEQEGHTSRAINEEEKK
jgi:hypothetical protein